MIVRKSVPPGQFVSPMLAQLTAELPGGAGWSHEPKIDGYRAVAVKSPGRASIFSRNKADFSKQFPTILQALASLEPDDLILDGEIAALDSNGRPNFQALQHRRAHPGHRVVYYVFDILRLREQDLTHQPLQLRRQSLTKALRRAPPTLRILRPLPGSTQAIIAAVREAGLEGVVAKRTSSIYRPGQRSSDWQKFRIYQQQEFVVGGYRPDPSIGLDALAVGYYADQQLVFAATVRAGFTPLVRQELLQHLAPLHVRRCPFANLPAEPASRPSAGIRPEQMSAFRWTRPQLIAQIRFQNWTLDGYLRQPSYSALRFDKDPRAVHRETPR